MSMCSLQKKEAQSDLIAGWKDSTKKHLRSCYLNFMTDANLLTVIDKKKTITPPILDIALERYLQSENEEVLVKALTGVN
ncbi:MAG: BrxA family protein [Eisenbergiella massiliensis]